MGRKQEKVLASSYRETKQVFSRNPGSYTIATISCFISLFCIGVVSVFGFFVYQGAQAVGTRFLNITVFLERSATQNEINQTIQSIESVKGVKKVTYVSPEEALEILKEEYPDMDTSHNPLPSSLRVEPKRAESVSPIVQFIEKLPTVDAIEDTSEHADAYSNIVRIMLILGVALLVIFLLAFVFSVSSSIGISVFSFRKEINIMQLIGASPGFVRAPFLLISILSGLIGGVCASFVMVPVVSYVYQFYQSFLFFSPIQIDTGTIALQLGVVLLILGLFISFFSAMFSVNRYVK